MLDFIYNCFCIPRKKESVKWILGEDEFKLSSKKSKN